MTHYDPRHPKIYSVVNKCTTTLYMIYTPGIDIAYRVSHQFQSGTIDSIKEWKDAVVEEH